LGRLAAIYHDTVYHQVDQGFIREVWAKIGDLVQIQENSRVVLAAELDEKAADTAAIFGFKPGEPIDAHGGLYEFLSAVLAVRELSSFIDRRESWTIAACIEATIPFRGRDRQGQLPMAGLHTRLQALGAHRGMNLSSDDITQMVQLAVRVANSDVQSFSQADVGSFLDDTWKLLPESNPEFMNSSAYSIRQYREALAKTESFLSALNPDVIFQKHQGYPTERVYGLLRGRAQANLAKGCEYLRAKIVTISILEALAETTGGDAPVSYFTGSAESGDVMAHSLLPEDEAIPQDGFPAIDPMVLHVLRYGRDIEASFDTAKSPLSAHLYEVLGTTGLSAQFIRAKQLHARKQGWRWFLDGLPHDMVSAIARAVAEIAVERRAKLLKIANKSVKPRKVAA
jgi:hypothetical protein